MVKPLTPPQEHSSVQRRAYLGNEDAFLASALPEGIG